ncbi:TPA: hypothetical protein ACH3X3_002199 [Trebouxia sp. C0006]
MNSSQTLTRTLEFSFRLRKPVPKAAKTTRRDRRTPDRAIPARALLSPKLLCSPPSPRPLIWQSTIPQARAWRKSATSGRQLRLCAEPEWVEPDIPPNQGLTPLYQAVKDCNLEVVKSILASGGDTT